MIILIWLLYLLFIFALVLQSLNFLIAIFSQSLAVVSTANIAARISPRLISAESAAKMSKYSSGAAVERAKWNGDSAIGLI